MLDLGCASGHHLLALAERFPESTFHGVDFSDTAVRRAREAAEAAGLRNVTFEHADLREWRPPWEGGGGKFDYVIAHGMLSWIDDEAKARLLELIGGGLADDGVACVDYNTLPGWALRREAAAMVRALPALHESAEGNLDVQLKKLARLAELGESPHAANLAAIFEDMRRKGPEVLPFDDLAPVCDPLHFSQVLRWAGDRGLRYLGESSPAENLPPQVDSEALQRLEAVRGDPVLFQQTLDLISGRRYRVSLFCGAEATLESRTPTSLVLDFAVRPRLSTLPDEAIHGEVAGHFHAAMMAAAPSARPVAALMEDCARRLGPRWEPARGAKAVADWLYQAARFGWVELRADPVETAGHPPSRPSLSPLNLHFARAGEALVDGFHQTCRYPENHLTVAAAMDGSRGLGELRELARNEAPELDFEPWMAHLAARGLFAGASA